MKISKILLEEQKHYLMEHGWKLETPGMDHFREKLFTEGISEETSSLSTNTRRFN